ALQLHPLDVERRVLEHRVLAAVVEVQVRVDHELDVARHQVVLGQRLGGRPVDHAPVGEHPLGAADAGVDQDRALRVHDHEAVDRPLALVRPAQAGQVEAADLEAGYSATPTINSTNSAAR